MWQEMTSKLYNIIHTYTIQVTCLQHCFYRFPSSCFTYLPFISDLATLHQSFRNPVSPTGHKPHHVAFSWGQLKPVWEMYNLESRWGNSLIYPYIGLKWPRKLSPPVGRCAIYVHQSVTKNIFPWIPGQFITIPNPQQRQGLERIPMLHLRFSVGCGFFKDFSHVPLDSPVNPHKGDDFGRYHRKIFSEVTLLEVSTSHISSKKKEVEQVSGVHWSTSWGNTWLLYVASIISNDKLNEDIQHRSALRHSSSSWSWTHLSYTAGTRFREDVWGLWVESPDPESLQEHAGFPLSGHTKPSK